MDKNITIILVTSVLPGHPDTSLINETISTIRHHLPNSEIIMQIDGLRKGQADRKDDYDLYKTRILWDCLHMHKNILPIVFEEHSHQTDMMKKTIDLIRTPLMLYIEGDAPLTPDRDIDWDKCIKYIMDGEANTIRFHHENVLPKEHESLMIGPTVNGFRKTYQWSQRPHLSSVKYYKDTVLRNVKDKYFIEDTFHGEVALDYLVDGMIG